ncbi:MAG: Transposase IS3/IS911 family protein [uncultured Thiotrichaceae bacterium]|uniref:Transposase IS3/IS911 family protein n=1 Tax=uncultured Thiotrichaceae bacterium TaxID=298394 RepID=A0A6S6SKW1_9GAMM|nr:MAG: Transposase IS3/IS911 family protein [uncultured Thiotrichaceae bacterium]
MTHYSSERKESVLKKLLPPHSMTVAAVAREEGVCEQTLYNWRNQAKQAGRPVPGKTKHSDQWSAESKLAVVIETTPLSESELSQYCREKGLYSDQVKTWKSECLSGFQVSAEQRKQSARQAQADKAEIKDLKRDLRIKEKALAETAALLVLRKKLHAFWGEDNEVK